MKKLCTCCAMLLALSTAAQNWELFPLGQRAWYADSSMDPVRVDLVVMDSVNGEGGTARKYFHAAIDRQLFGACAGAVQGQLPWLLPDALYRMDSLVEQHDTVRFFTPYGTLPFYFLPQASPGQSWTVASDYPGNGYGNITITCTGNEVRHFLGITDSVKTFAMEADGSSPGQVPVNECTMVLSKAHGLLEYVPFVLFAYHPPQVDFTTLELIGLDAAGMAHGYRQPGLHDYFHLSPGDVLQWQHVNDPGWITEPTTTTYTRDSITATLVTEDSVQYTMNRRWQYPDFSTAYQVGVTAVYRRADWETALAGMPGYLATGSPASVSFTGFGELLWWSEPMEISMAPDGLDTVTAYGFQTDGMALDTLECWVTSPSDQRTSLWLNTRTGLTRMESWLNPSTFTSTLVGYTIGGQSVGDINLGIQGGMPPPGRVRLWPNPVKDRAQVELPESGAPWQYALTDALGHDRGSGPWPADGLDTGNLPPGLYLLRLRTDGQAAQLRFVKE